MKLRRPLTLATAAIAIAVTPVITLSACGGDDTTPVVKSSAPGATPSAIPSTAASKAAAAVQKAKAEVTKAKKSEQAKKAKKDVPEAQDDLCARLDQEQKKAAESAFGSDMC
jgi:hypothetical protein